MGEITVNVKLLSYIWASIYQRLLICCILFL